MTMTIMLASGILKLCLLQSDTYYIAAVAHFMMTAHQCFLFVVSMHPDYNRPSLWITVSEIS